MNAYKLIFNDKFNVSMDYLLGREVESIALTKRDEKASTLGHVQRIANGARGTYF